MKPDMSLSPDERIVEEAKERFQRAEEWESTARANFLFDMRFANGDSVNMFQWHDDIRADRDANNKPCLTINRTKQHCLQIINDQLQNPSQISVRPVGNGATFDAAQVFSGLCRHIEYNSNAQAAYGNACYSQVIGGIGYWRVVTDYASDDSFDQEIFIRRIADALTVYLDPDIMEADGSDASFACIFTDMPRDEFEREYPRADDTNNAPLGVGDHWENKDHVRICEYFRKNLKRDKLHLLDNGTTVKLSDVKADHARRKAEHPGYDEQEQDMLDTLNAHTVNVREIENPEIEWFLIAGSKILDRKPFLGKYIPIVRVIGEETVIDKVLDRKGHVRSLIDPQRIYNYWSSSCVEHVALQTKTPYLTPVEAIAGVEENWARANIDNAAYLPFNSLDESGNPIPPPQRAQPPVMSQAYLDGLKISANEMMVVSGQYEANMGAKSNEVSGTAVDARQRQGDNATYNYINRMAQAIRFTGRILVDLIPKIYDTPRVIRILAENGDQSSVQVDPAHPAGHTPLQNPDAHDFKPDAIQAIFNPTVGQFDVEADVGPNFATRRQEAFNAISQILKVNKDLTPIIGDLLFRAADFPMADEIGQRMHNMVPKQALTGDQGPDPHISEMQQMLAKQHEVMQKQAQELQDAKNKIKEQDAQKEIDWYKAESDRFKNMGTVDPDSIRPIVREMVSQFFGQPINPIIAAHAEEMADLPQQPEAPPSPIAPPAPESSK